MALKPRTRRIIVQTVITIVATALLGIIIAPHLITLNHLKPRLESAIEHQTGINTAILGDVHFSLLGRATIVAHNIKIPNGNVGAAMFNVPLHYLTHLENAPLNASITVYDANLEINRLSAPEFPHDIKIRNSTIRFLNKDYEIISGEISDGQFRGIVRTDQHKYEINYDGDEFVVTNRNNDLTIRGILYEDGAARGELSLQTNDVNKWFQFREPKIDMPIRASMDFEWDGQYGVRFSNIRGDNFGGAIDIFPDGARDIKLRGRDIKFDFSFLTDPSKIFIDAKFDLDFYGELKLGPRTFKHLKVQAIGTRDALQISNIVADDITISGGVINGTGAHDLMIVMPLNGQNTRCIFSGTPDIWQCREFTYGDISGTISVNRGVFDATITSSAPMPDIKSLTAQFNRIGRTGTIRFEFADARGEINIKNGRATPRFSAAINRPFSWAGIDLPFLPSDMRNSVGDFQWSDGMIIFSPSNGDWLIESKSDYFRISGQNAKQWLPNFDLAAIDDFPYSISGYYRRGAISDLVIEIAGHVFTGSATGRAITLKTDTLNIDAFISQDYIDNYEELEFLGPSPIMQMFDIPVRVSLSSASVIYNGDEFKNFVYTLQPSAQIFSISDTARGALLATIEKEKNTYDISLQLNRFSIAGTLLGADMPLNVRDTAITAEILLSTYGNIAHDVWYNITGTLDMSFDGGEITGLGIDEFYAAANDITILNAEYALSDALESGASRIKKLHIAGQITRDEFKTTTPMALSLRHATAIGEMEIKNGQMYAALDITMRGTAPSPVTIALNVLPNGGREYSLSEIMREFDPGFMRAFLKTHDRF